MKKNWKSKNDLKSPLRALNKELWAIYVFSSNLKVHDFQKHQRKQPKIKTLWRIEFQPQKDPKNATWKKEFKARLEALIYSFDVFSMFFNTNKLVVRVDGWLGGWMMIKSVPRKIQAIRADSKYGVKNCLLLLDPKLKPN